MKLITIGGHRKSGTTLLASLLDGHPNLFVYPYDLHWTYSFYPEYIKSKYSKKEKITQITNIILPDLYQILEKWVKYDKQTIQNKIKPEIERRIRNYLQNKNSTKDYLDAQIKSVVAVLGKEPNNTIVIKDTHCEVYANLLFNFYPDSKFVNIIRDPRDNFASILTGWDKHYKNQYDSKERLLRDFIDRGYLCMRMAKDNAIKFGVGKYITIRYENLVQYPIQVMAELCQWIGIRESLLNLNPTFCGVEWKGNSFTKTYKGISKNRIGIYKEILSKYQRKVIEYYFGDLMESFGYALDYKKEECVNAIREHYKWLNANGFHSGKPYRKY